MKPAFKILLIEDNPGDARLIEIQLREIERAEVTLEHAATLAAGHERLARGDIDVVLLDLGLPDSQGLDTLVKTKAAAAQVPIVVLTGTDDEELAVQAVRQGAQDYLVKGQVNALLLERAVRYAIERAQADEKIAYLASFPEMNPNPVAEVDREGRVHYMNPAARRLFPDLEQRGVSHPLLAGLGEIFEGFAGGVPASSTRVIAAGDQSYQMSFKFLEETSRLRLYAVNITARKQAEEAVRQNNEILEERVRLRTAELESANHELESFAYSVSHDLRAPLRAMEGFSQALLEDYGDKLDAHGKDHIQRVHSAVGRMSELIDDLLVLSRATRAEMDRKPVDLTALAREIGADLLKTYPKRSVSFVVADGLQAAGDIALLRQVLQNLLENAWKFTSRRTEARIEVGSMLQAGRRVFFVRDNGAGFEMNYADKLFGAFQRLHTVEEFPGTGIGLATVQRIVRRHGGKVWAEGEPNRGATFFFTL